MDSNDVPRPGGGWAGELIRDLIGLAGLGCITVGLWQVHPPTALVTLGTLLFALAVCSAFLTPGGRD